MSLATEDPGLFWAPQRKSSAANAKESRQAFQEFVARVQASPGVVLFDAVEAGVPTRMVHLISWATGESAAEVMELIGVSPTTFRRKEEGGEPLPDMAGHRVMGFCRGRRRWAGMRSPKARCRAHKVRPG